jgi:hypothetical protein
MLLGVLAARHSTQAKDDVSATIFLTPSKRNITHGLRTQHNGGNIIFRREWLDIWHPTAVNGQQQYATAATAKDNISLNVGTVSQFGQIRHAQVTHIVERVEH